MRVVFKIKNGSEIVSFDITEATVAEIMKKKKQLGQVKNSPIEISVEN